MVEGNQMFNSYILEKSAQGEVIDRQEKTNNGFVHQYQAKLAVLDDNGNPYGTVDDLLISINPDNLLIKDNDNQTSIDLMSKAIKEASDKGFHSIAISTDTLEEIKEVREQIAKLLQEDPQMQKIGFFYPDTE